MFSAGQYYLTFYDDIIEIWRILQVEPEQVFRWYPLQIPSCNCRKSPAEINLFNSQYIIILSDQQLWTDKSSWVFSNFVKHIRLATRIILISEFLYAICVCKDTYLTCDDRALVAIHVTIRHSLSRRITFPQIQLLFLLEWYPNIDTCNRKQEFLYRNSFIHSFINDSITLCWALTSSSVS
jgi:hypothetical protein